MSIFVNHVKCIVAVSPFPITGGIHIADKCLVAKLVCFKF